MAVSETQPKVTFWFGCNMLRHAELIRLSIALLERAGYDVAAAGGPGYCCGTAHDHQPKAASTMAGRTVQRFNDAADVDGRAKVVTWCPSCHMHMADIMAPGNPVRFDIAHVTELLAEAADRLAPLMTRSVERRILLHRHQGFAGHVPVNTRVASLLARIPGLSIVEGPSVPGHMCSALSAVPGALPSAVTRTVAAAREAKADTLVTIFHSCHRELVALDGRDGLAVRNWIHLVAEAMDMPAEDAYRDWRKGLPPNPLSVARAGQDHFERLISGELAKPPPI